MTGYYRNFIKNYGIITSCLNKLTSIKNAFKWEDIHQIAFEDLKEKLINPPVLIYPDFNCEFTVTCDASGGGIGAVLSQVSDGKDKPVAFASRAWNDREKKQSLDSAIEKKLLEVVWLVKHWNQYLYGRHFKIVTDHKPLTYLNSMCNSNYRMKMKNDLAQYDFEIKYKKRMFEYKRRCVK